MSHLIHCTVHGTNPQGEADWDFVQVEVPDDFELCEETIDHLLTAMLASKAEGWEPIMATDAKDPPAYITELIGGLWQNARVVPLRDLEEIERVRLLGEVAFNAFLDLASREIITKHELLGRLRYCLDEFAAREGLIEVPYRP